MAKQQTASPPTPGPSAPAAASSRFRPAANEDPACLQTQSSDLTIAGQEYVLVPKLVRSDAKAGDDVKSPAALASVVPLTVRFRPPKGMRRTGASLRGQPVMGFKIWESIAVASGANTAYSTVHALQPKNCQDWTAIAALFDTVRCTGITVHMTTSTSGGTPSNTPNGVVAFDPGTAVALTSVQDGLSHPEKFGPFRIANNYGGSCPNAVTSSGFFPTWTAKTIPNFESGLTSDLVGSNWFPCTSAVSAIVGYLAPYLEASGSGVIVALNIYAEYHMECTMRH